MMRRRCRRESARCLSWSLALCRAFGFLATAFTPVLDALVNPRDAQPRSQHAADHCKKADLPGREPRLFDDDLQPRAPNRLLDGLSGIPAFPSDLDGCVHDLLAWSFGNDVPFPSHA